MGLPVAGRDARVNSPEAFALYRYQPSLPAAIFFVICFAITTFIHVFQAWKHRTYYFTPLVIGGFFEWVGYIARALAHDHQFNLSIYIMQTLLLLLAPALFAASIYMILGRLILFTDAESLSPIRSSWLTKIFVCGDVLSFLIQSGGIPPVVACLNLYITMMTSGGLMAKASTMDTGKNIVVVGLVLQILFFGVFLVTASLFHFRIIQCPTPVSHNQSWQKYLYALYAASILILIRSLFRVAEFMGGYSGHLMSKEWYLYVFDAVLMFGVMVCFNVVHPGTIIGRKAQGQAVRLNDMEGSSKNLAYDQK